MARPARRPQPRRQAAATAAERPSATRTRNIPTAELERHPAAGRTAALAVTTNLVSHRWADGGHQRSRLLCTAGLPGDPEVAHQHAADPAAAVVPVGAVPAHDRGEAAVDLHAPVIDLPVAAGPRGDREPRRLRGGEPGGATVVGGDVPFRVVDAERVVLVAARW